MVKARKSNITQTPPAKAGGLPGPGEERPGNEAFRAIDRMRAALVGQWTAASLRPP